MLVATCQHQRIAFLCTHTPARALAHCEAVSYGRSILVTQVNRG